MFLETIMTPSDLKKLTFDQMERLAQEIRSYLLEVVSRTGGHLAPNLGVVELSIALHYVFNSPQDKIIWEYGAGMKDQKHPDGFLHPHPQYLHDPEQI